MNGVYFLFFTMMLLKGNALLFYLFPSESKCFIDETPANTV